jgi:hypothetical protein
LKEVRPHGRIARPQQFDVAARDGYRADFSQIPPAGFLPAFAAHNTIRETATVGR